MIFDCIEDGVAPKEIIAAGKKGKLQVNSVIGWLTLSKSDFTGVKNSCSYRIKA